MSTLRIQRMNKFTTMPNEIVNDPTLSLKAKGLLLILLSKPDGWEFHIEPLIELSKDGRDSFYTGFNELKEAGFVRKFPIREKGRIVRYETIVSDTRMDSPQLPENPETVDTAQDFTASGKPVNRKPVKGNPDTINTDSNNTDSNNTDIINHHYMKHDVDLKIKQMKMDYIKKTYLNIDDESADILWEISQSLIVEYFEFVPFESFEEVVKRCLKSKPSELRTYLIAALTAEFHKYNKERNVK
jgi:hypothetical protein